VDEKRAYDISDLYIQKMDLMDDPAEIKCLGDDAFAFYLREVQSVAKKRVVSRHVSLCLDYIYNHLHEPIPVRELADLTGLSPSYLSALFKSEMGQPISEYIMAKKMEAAQNMLRYTDYSSAEISSTLNFSSQSHFIRAFKRHTGETPKRYREQNRSSSTPEENACG
jgi:AraC-like DNA-binding protein